MSSDNTNPTATDDGEAIMGNMYGTNHATQWTYTQAQQGQRPTPMTGFGHQPFHPGMVANNPHPSGMVYGSHPAGLNAPQYVSGFPAGGLYPGASPFPNQPYPQMSVPGQGSWAQQPPTTLGEIMVVFNGEFTAHSGCGCVLGTPSRQGRVLVTVEMKPNGTFSLVFTTQSAHFGAGQSVKPNRLEQHIPVALSDIKVCVVQLKDKVVSVFVAGRNSDLFEHVEVGKIFFSEAEILQSRIEELENELKTFKKLA